MTSGSITVATGLSPKRKRFCEEYVIDLNGTQAAIRAGYSSKNKKSAETQAVRLLGNVGVQEEIARLQKAKSQSTKVSAERVVEELARIAFFDPRKMYDDEGNKLELHEMDEDTALALGAKIVDKKGALDTLAKHTGVVSDSKIDIQATGKVVFLMSEEGRN